LLADSYCALVVIHFNNRKLIKVMRKWIPYTSDEWAIIPGAPGTGVKLIYIALGEKNTLRKLDGNRTFKKDAIVIEYSDKSIHYDPDDVVI